MVGWVGSEFKNMLCVTIIIEWLKLALFVLCR